ncbi:hypothetical protein AFCDBAGC_1634 [Methylobacterium cerastii]|uniref:Uncharacterized protein n=1 Tax=Methylobacterium cerastii TaxID=932741 RepID=A0ABQ4QFF7_9HYPH|nr:hypothetical protein AFCDBAGC_1634 [Methylobacterium cerastii]
MAIQDKLEEIADACLALHEEIKRHGTTEMQHFIRLLLFQVGQELARQQAASQE